MSESSPHRSSAGVAVSAGSMHVQQTQVSSDSLRPVDENAPRRRDVHPAPSGAVKPNTSKSNATKENNLIHQAAQRRLNVNNPSQNAPSNAPSTPISEPVLVRAAPQKPEMKRKAKANFTSPNLPPPPESFSFQNILAAIGPEADAAIEAIAEICGRSKMSLAEEHASHLPPHGEALTVVSEDAFPSLRLEPLIEITGHKPHTRSMSHLAKEGSPGSATAATSKVTSHTHTTMSGQNNSAPSSRDSAVLPQVLAWLRGSGTPSAHAVSRFSDRDVGAANALHRLLSNSEGVES